MHNILRKGRSIGKSILSLPLLRPNFLHIHYAYIIGCILLTSIIIYSGGAPGLKYVDALFFASGASTQSGLNTIDVNLLHTDQQAVIWFVAMVTNPIFVNTIVVFIRLHWFERRFQNVVRDSQALRRMRSSARTRTRALSRNGHDRQKTGVRGRPITIIHVSKARWIERIGKMNHQKTTHPRTMTFRTLGSTAPKNFSRPLFTVPHRQRDYNKSNRWTRNVPSPFWRANEPKMTPCGFRVRVSTSVGVNHMSSMRRKKSHPHFAGHQHCNLALI